MAEEKRPPGLARVVVVAAAVVGVVAAAVVLTWLLPDDLEAVVYRTPLTIAVLVAGTGWVLWRISRRERS